jgi:hypothetical protein
MFRSLIATLTLVLAVAAPALAGSPMPTPYAFQTQSQMRAAQREAIRQLPLLQRPNRPGHFYGNTVRRLHGV